MPLPPALTLRFALICGRMTRRPTAAADRSTWFAVGLLFPNGLLLSRLVLETEHEQANFLIERLLRPQRYRCRICQYQGWKPFRIELGKLVLEKLLVFTREEMVRCPVCAADDELHDQM